MEIKVGVLEEAGRLKHIAPVEYSGLGIRFFPGGLQGPGRELVGSVSLSLPAPSPERPRTQALRAVRSSALLLYLEQHLLAAPVITPERAAPAQLPGCLESGPSRSERPPLFLP
jgi:hypothetical protein